MAVQAAGILVLSKRGGNYRTALPGPGLGHEVDALGGAAAHQDLARRYAVVGGYPRGQAFGQHLGVAVDGGPLAEYVVFQPRRLAAVPHVGAEISPDFVGLAVAIVAVSVQHIRGFS